MMKQQRETAAGRERKQLQEQQQLWLSEVAQLGLVLGQLLLQQQVLLALVWHAACGRGCC
jgi:hypothetical protein